MPELFNKAFPASKAFLIGVENYTGGLSPLQTPFNDIDDLKSVLESAHGFLCPEVVDEDTGRVMPNPLKDPTANDIRTYLQNIRCGPNDRVLVYFACHGIAEEWDERPKGFILAADAGMKKGAGYVSMDEIMSGLEHLSCRHLLLVLDCCFAGAIRWASNTRGISGMVPKSISVELFSQFSQSCARQILTSSTFEESLDTIGTRENKGRNSPFAGILIDALETGAADLRFGQDQCDGLISVSELHLYIRDRIFRMQHAGRRKLENRQIPLLLPFGKHDKGEFVFLNPKVPLGLQRRSEFNPYKGTAEYGFADSAVFYGREVLLRVIRGSGFDIPEKGGGITVIYGPARCGKTSLAKAGLLARYWRKDTSLTKVHTIGAGSSLHEGFREVLKEVYESRETQYLLIDPFDEWLSDSIGAQESRMMTEAVSKLSDMHQIVLILRPLQERKLRKLLASGAEMYRGWKDKISWFEVTPPSADEIMGMIERPAVQQMLPFTSDEADDQGGENFINRLVQDLLDEPGAISLLSQTMYRLYKDRAMSHDSLSESSYDNFGTVTGVLAGQAESIYALYAEDEADRKAFQLLCFRMVQFSGGKIVSNKVNVSGWLREGPDELQYTDAATSLRIWRISQELLRAGVITEELKGDEYFLLPAHGRFFPKWERMQGWLSEKQDGQEVKSVVRLHHSLAEAAAGWESMPAAKQNQLLGTWAARHDLWEMEKALKPMLNKQEEVFFQQVTDRRKSNVRRRMVRNMAGGGVILALTIIVLISSYKSWQAELRELVDKLKVESALHPPAVKARMLEWASRMFPSAQTDSLLADTWNTGIQELYFSHRIVPVEGKVQRVMRTANGFLAVYIDSTAVLMDKEGRIIRHFRDTAFTKVSYSGRYFLRGDAAHIGIWNDAGLLQKAPVMEPLTFAMFFNGSADDVIYYVDLEESSFSTKRRFIVWRPGVGVIYDISTDKMPRPQGNKLSESIHFIPERNAMMVSGADEAMDSSFHMVQIGSGVYLFDKDGNRRHISHAILHHYDAGFMQLQEKDGTFQFVDQYDWPYDGRKNIWYDGSVGPKVSGDYTKGLVIDEKGDCIWGGLAKGDTSRWEFNLTYRDIDYEMLSGDGSKLYALIDGLLVIADYKTRGIVYQKLPLMQKPGDERPPGRVIQVSSSGNYLIISNREQRVLYSVKKQTFNYISPQFINPIFANQEGDTLLAASAVGNFLHFITETATDRNLNRYDYASVIRRLVIRPGSNVLLLYSDSLPPLGFSLSDHQWLDPAAIPAILKPHEKLMATCRDSTVLFRNIYGDEWKLHLNGFVVQVLYSGIHQRAIVELMRNELLLVDVKAKTTHPIPLHFFEFRGCMVDGDNILLTGDSLICAINPASGAVVDTTVRHFPFGGYFFDPSCNGDYLYGTYGEIQYCNLVNGLKWKIDTDDLEVYSAAFQQENILLTGHSKNAGSYIRYIVERENGGIVWKHPAMENRQDKSYDKSNGQIFYFDNGELKVHSFPDRIRQLLRSPILPPLPESIRRQWTPKRLESWWNYVFSTNE